MKKKKPQLYIIAGPNGAGKTTFAREYLPKYVHCPEFVNADEIAARFPKRSNIHAGKIFLRKIKGLAGKKADFAFETTLSGKSYLSWLSQLKNEGYAIHLFYLWIPSIDFSLARIKDRVKRGGHNIPEKDVRRRYQKSVRNFKFYRSVLDTWTYFDNSQGSPKRIFSGQVNGKITIENKKLYSKIMKVIQK